MTNILLIHSSVFGEKSQSLGLARDFLQRYPHRSLVERALTSQTMPHLDGETFVAMGTDAGQHSGRQKEAVALSDELIAELEAADTIVLAVPMYNFSIPSTLKAWIDHVARRGRTFRYTEKGPEGLLRNKKVFALVSRGGVYSKGSPAAHFDFQEPYLRTVLGFLGLTDVTFVHFEGVGMGPEAAAANRRKALADVERLTRGAVAEAAD
ncbi:MAG TPA: FMN-dependent NADH-azoreductase [Reyranella sp.]|nr:FMN-dependent NADH-azoreductase [Reyranella sp.]